MGPPEWMLRLLSSGSSGRDSGQGGGGAVFELGAGACADFELSEPLVWDAERGGEDGERNVDALPFGAQLPIDAVSVPGLFRAA